MIGQSSFHQRHSWQHTNCEPRKAQNPEASADKMNTWPVSRTRMPTQTLASHTLLYSDAFFIRLDLRRPCFWRMDFLTDLDRLEWVGDAEAMLRDASKRHYWE